MALRLLLNPAAEQLEAIAENIAKLRRCEDRSPFQAFQLASALISHVDKVLVGEGLQIMEALAFQQWQVVTSDRRESTGSAGGKDRENMTMLGDCYFYVAVGHTKLNDLVKARSSVERMLELIPGHPQGVALRQHIDDQLWRDGVLGLGGLAVAGLAGVLVAAALRRK